MTGLGGIAPAPPAVPRGAGRALLVASALTVALWVVPFGKVIGLPLLWVATLVHELGHAIAAAAVGGDVDSVRVFANGSGVTRSAVPSGDLRKALVSAGGLVGPAFGAGVLFAFGRRPTAARIAAAALGVVLAVATLVMVRGVVGPLVALALSAALLVSARARRPTVSQTLVLFLAVQLSLSVFSGRGYLFTRFADTGAGRLPSDSEQMAQALIGPYWFWGAVCGLVSVAVLLLGLWAVLRDLAGDDEGPGTTPG